MATLSINTTLIKADSFGGFVFKHLGRTITLFFQFSRICSLWFSHSYSCLYYLGELGQASCAATAVALLGLEPITFISYIHVPNHHATCWPIYVPSVGLEAVPSRRGQDARPSQGTENILGTPILLHSGRKLSNWALIPAACNGTNSPAHCVPMPV